MKQNDSYNEKITTKGHKQTIILCMIQMPCKVDCYHTRRVAERRVTRFGSEEDRRQLKHGMMV